VTQGDLRLHLNEANWFAVYSKPRQEQIALENLQRQGFSCFLPMAVNPYQRRSLNNPRIEPLFPRYLFLHAVADRQSLGPVRSTRGVSTLVRFGSELAHVPGDIIRAIRSRCDPDTGLVRLDQVPVTPGDKVRVFDGPLAGVSGLFQACSGEQRALLLIEFMGRQTRVEVDRLLLQKVV
jgi:transcriptional antiterminator RfaH